MQALLPPRMLLLCAGSAQFRAPDFSCRRRSSLNYLRGWQGEELAAKVRRRLRERRLAGSASEPPPVSANPYLGVPPVSAAVQPFLTKLGCSIKDGSLLCEFLLRKMMKR